MTKPKRLTDDELAHEAAESRRKKALASDLYDEAREHTAKVVAEMQARKAPVQVVGGVRITLKTTKKFLSLDRARTLLPRRVLNVVTRSEISREAWNLEKAAGRISDEDETHCTIEQDVTPFVFVYPVKGAAKDAA